MRVLLPIAENMTTKTGANNIKTEAFMEDVSESPLKNAVMLNAIPKKAATKS